MNIPHNCRATNVRRFSFLTKKQKTIFRITGKGMKMKFYAKKGLALSGLGDKATT
jgi:hypothetical protein